MSIYLEEIRQTVLPKFDFVVEQIQPFSSNWWKLTTNKGSKWLRLDTDPLQVKIRYSITEQLAHAAYRKVPRMIRNREGEAYVQVEGRIYTCADEWVGRPIQWNSEDAYLCGENLAVIHRALSYILWPQDVKLKNQCGQWDIRFQDAAAVMRDTFSFHSKSALVDSLNAVSHSMEWLSRSGYREFCKSSQGQQSICLGDYNPRNMILTPQQQVVNLEYDQVLQDLVIYDIGKAVLHAVDHQANEFIRPFLDGYQSLKPLSTIEKGCLWGYMTFPHTVYTVCEWYRRSQNRATVNWDAQFQEARHKYQLLLQALPFA